MNLDRINCDVLIIGAGLAGTTLALQIRNENPDIKIVITDKKSMPKTPRHWCRRRIYC